MVILMTTGKNKRFFHVIAENFKKIPGSPMAYWACEILFSIFQKVPDLSHYGFAGIGMRTGDNERFLRFWFEVSFRNILLNCPSAQYQIEMKRKWVPYNKGGAFRKWYGNNEYIVNWLNDGFEIKENTRRVYPQLGDNLGWKISNEQYYYKPGITWSGVGQSIFGCRCYDTGFIFDSGANGFFVYDKENYYFFAGCLNSNVTDYILKILNPTINTGSGTINRIPIPPAFSNKLAVNDLAKRNITSSVEDWDSFETSWNFRASPLIEANQRSQTPGIISRAYFQLREEWRRSCEEMRRLEVENNRIFIEAYGLQDELSPEVPWNEITLTCNPWYRYGKSPKTVFRNGEELLESTSDLPVSDNWGIEHGGRIIVMPPVVRMKSRSMPFNQDLETRLLSDTVKEFISYSVGCMMGRYSPEKPGLILADQGSTLDDYLNIMGEREAKKLALGDSYLETMKSRISESYAVYNCCGFQYHRIIDFDGVLPILDEEWFADDIVTQFRNFVSLAFGAENLTANLGFIENVLGKDIRKYFVKDFYKDHVQRYKKRPIYWLFSSPKGSFNALIYLHRYTPDTVSIVLNEYLRELMTKIRTRIEHLERENNRADLGNAEKARNLKKIDKYTAQLTELEDYERDILFPLAQQKIAIDLDDGVKVNYIKFGPALKKISGLEAKEE